MHFKTLCDVLRGEQTRFRQMDKQKEKIGRSAPQEYLICMGSL